MPTMNRAGGLMDDAFARGRAEKVDHLRGNPEMLLKGESVGSLPADDPDAGTDAENAIIRATRPAIPIMGDYFDVSPAEEDILGSTEIVDALRSCAVQLSGPIPSVGRIELVHEGDDREQVGTGWVVAAGEDPVIITNAHVAREFSERRGGHLAFRPSVADPNKPQSAQIDFLGEIGEIRTKAFPVTEVVWISRDPWLDMALLRVPLAHGYISLGSPIELGDLPSDVGRMVAVIGYPGSGDGYDQEQFRRLFGPTLGRKMFSPGRLLPMHGVGRY